MSPTFEYGSPNTAFTAYGAEQISGVGDASCTPNYVDAYGKIIRDSSRCNSFASGNWLRKYSMKRRARGRPFVCKSPIRYRNTNN